MHKFGIASQTVKTIQNTEKETALAASELTFANCTALSFLTARSSSLSRTVKTAVDPHGSRNFSAFPYQRQQTAPERSAIDLTADLASLSKADRGHSHKTNKTPGLFAQECKRTQSPGSISARLLNRRTTACLSQYLPALLDGLPLITADRLHWRRRQ